jgi:ABC-type nitrate/sulfonate/bicarbonate transport system substrate-binding protein
MGLLSGSVDFYAGAITDAILSQAQGQDTVSITPVYRGFGGSLVLAKSVADKLGVSAGSPLDAKLKSLNGLIVATPSATSTYTLTLSAAAAIAGSKVTLTYMAQPAMVAALQTGAIQGMMVGAPYYAQAEIAGTGTTLLSGPKGEFPKGTTASYAVVLNAKRDYAVAHRDVVAKLNRVFAELSEATAERPAEVRAALGRVFPSLDAKTLDLIFSSEAHGFTTSPLTEADVAQDIAYLQSNGIKFSQPQRVTPENILFK